MVNKIFYQLNWSDHFEVKNINENMEKWNIKHHSENHDRIWFDITLTFVKLFTRFLKHF